jgi:hypothetical protein
MPKMDKIITPHTPLPWVEENCNRKYSDVFGAEKGYRTVVNYNFRRRDARYIVRACNAYPVLVKTLQKIRDEWDNGLICASDASLIAAEAREKAGVE